MLLTITSWVKSIILVVIFASFMELLLPNTSMKKFIRVIMGIFIMLAILNPVLSFFQNAKADEHIAVLGAKDDVKDSKTENINQIVESTVAKREELVGAAYKQDLARQMSAVIKSIAGVEDAHVNINMSDGNKIGKITIYLKPATESSKNIKIESIDLAKSQNIRIQQGLKEKVQQTVSELYHILPQNIRFEPLS